MKSGRDMAESEIIIRNGHGLIVRKPLVLLLTIWSLVGPVLSFAASAAIRVYRLDRVCQDVSVLQKDVATLQDTSSFTKGQLAVILQQLIDLRNDVRELKR